MTNEITDKFILDIFKNQALASLLLCYNSPDEETFRNEYLKIPGSKDYKKEFKLFFVDSYTFLTKINSKITELEKFRSNIMMNIQNSLELYDFDMGENPDFLIRTLFNTICEMYKKIYINANLDVFDLESNAFYRHIVDKYRGEYKTNILNDMIDLFAFMNNRKGVNDFVNINENKFLLTQEVEVDEELISEDHKLMISNFDHDAHNKTCVIENYVPCGLINYSIDYFTHNGYTVITKFGPSLPFKIIDKSGDETISYNVDADGKPLYDKVIFIVNNNPELLFESKHSLVNDETKFLIFTNYVDGRIQNLKKNFEFNAADYYRLSGIKIHNFGKAQINSYKEIFKIFFINYMHMFTPFIKYSDEIAGLCKEYVDILEDQSPFGSIRKNVINNYDSIVDKMGREYDDSRTGLIKKFMMPYYLYLLTNLDYTPFSICLYGAPGTGKSYFAYKIADLIFNGESSAHTIALGSGGSIEMLNAELFGASKGYAGSNKKTVFQKFIEDNMHSGGVILLDEVDKAKEEVIDMFLTILSTGKVNFNGEHACELDVSKFVFVWCGNYNKKGTDIYEITNASKAFESRMRLIEQVYESDDKEKLISTIFYKEICDRVRRYGVHDNINIVIDESIAKLSFFAGNKINGREYRSFILSKFGLVIANIINVIINEKKTNFHLSIDVENEKINIEKY